MDGNSQGNLFIGWQNGEPLPHAENAVIEEQKFTAYAMNPSHPRQVEANKWHAYAEVGYELITMNDRLLSARDVIAQIKENLKTTGAFLVLTTPYGSRMEVAILIVGPNGKSLTLRTIWQYDRDTAFPHLITAIGELPK